MRKETNAIALGGMLGAAAMVVMLLGGLIPVSTYICPVMCMLILQTVINLCGKRIAWAWYAMVALLSLLLGPDKEAAALLLLLGYYPIIKPKMDSLPLKLLWKLVLFNAVTLFMYTAAAALLGLEAIIVEPDFIGYASLVLMILLGNATFFMLDTILNRVAAKKARKA